MSSITTGEVRDPVTGESIILKQKPQNVSVNPKYDPTSTFVDIDALTDVCKSMQYKTYNVISGQSETTNYSSITKDKILGK